MNKELLLYGLAKGEHRKYMEQLLLSNGTPETVEKAKVLAKRDGFHSFRVTAFVEGKPDFAGAIRVKGLNVKELNKIEQIIGKI